MGDGPQSEDALPTSALSSIATELLLERHTEGDEGAATKLFLRVRRRLLGAIRDHPSAPFLPSTHTADDVLQDLWLTVFERGSLDRFQNLGPGSLRAFLRRCLDNTMIDACRIAGADKRGRDVPHQPIDAGMPSMAGPVHPPDRGPGPATVAEWEDWQGRCLRVLHGQEREVWRLRFVEDLEYAGIASHLEISESAARSSYHRAIAHLHQSGILNLE